MLFQSSIIETNVPENDSSQKNKRTEKANQRITLGKGTSGHFNKSNSLIQLLKEKHLIEYVNAKNDANGSVQSYKTRMGLNHEKNQEDLQKQSVETFKNLRKANKRDSIETSKQNRSAVNDSLSKPTKMLTIGQVFGIQKERKLPKSKTLRSDLVSPKSPKNQSTLSSAIENIKHLAVTEFLRKDPDS